MDVLAWWIGVLACAWLLDRLTDRTSLRLAREALTSFRHPSSTHMTCSTTSGAFDDQKPPEEPRRRRFDHPTRAWAWTDADLDPGSEDGGLILSALEGDPWGKEFETVWERSSS